MSVTARDIWDDFWRDKDGHIVIWQMPNIFLISWVILTIISLVLTGTISDVFSWAGIVALIVWALLEILKGVNYFRRTPGVIVMILEIMSIINII